LIVGASRGSAPGPARPGPPPPPGPAGPLASRRRCTRVWRTDACGRPPAEGAAGVGVGVGTASPPVAPGRAPSCRLPPVRCSPHAAAASAAKEAARAAPCRCPAWGREWGVVCVWGGGGEGGGGRAGHGRKAAQGGPGPVDAPPPPTYTHSVCSSHDMCRGQRGLHECSVCSVPRRTGAAGIYSNIKSTFRF
jgi:hypothetical protein